MDNKMLTKKDAAEFLSVSPATVERIIASGKLPCYKIGGQIRLSAADLMRYVESCRKEAAAPAPVKKAPRRRKAEERGPCLYYPGMRVV